MTEPDRSHDWLAPSAAHVRRFLDLPELAIVEESCRAERMLNASLRDDPLRRVSVGELDAFEDDDARSNHRTFVRFRDALVAAGTFEAYYLALMRSGHVEVPPVFVSRVVEAIVSHLFDGQDDAFERRAAQFLHRPQQVAVSERRVLAADLEAARHASNQDASTIDVIGSLLRADAGIAGLHLPVLGPDNAQLFTAEGDPPSFVLDLTHETTRDVGHGVAFTLARPHSGMAALARVLERWTLHFTGVATAIVPLERIDDPAWRWHIGLDAEASRMLDDLYRGVELDPSRAARLIGLFRLTFADPAEMRADVAGKPVWLGLATDESWALKLKPQNLLLNLPLATAM